ncbi:MAG: Hsp70 family protein, partial [Pseudonocardiaceae bacterium]
MSYVVGVDLGTTYTAAAVLRRDDQPGVDPGRDGRERDGRVEVVELGDRVASVASVLWFRDDHGLVVGEAAVRRAESEPGRVAREFKRRFGDPVPIMVAGTPISADALTARLLRWVVDVVTEQEGGEPAVVGVTHPANWGPYKLDLLAQAVRLAGVSHARFVSEPHAAAESHATASRVPAGDVVAVYDLGGGTFDAAVLRRSDSGFELLGADGIERLGGIDFDEAVFGHVREVIGPGLTALDQADPVVAQASARLRDDCARAKEALSSDTEVSIPVALPGLHTTVRLCRGEFEEMIRPIVASTIDTLARAITSAGLTPAQVSKVLLVGGSSRIPLVSLMIGAELGCP